MVPSSSFSSSSKQGAVALTLRLLLVSLAVVAMCIMLFNLSFAYTRLANHHHHYHHNSNHNHLHHNSGPNGGDGTLSWQEGIRNRLPNRHRRHREGLQRDQFQQEEHPPQYQPMHNGAVSEELAGRGEAKKNKINNDCSVISSINDMLRCYRPDLVDRLYRGLKRVPEACRRRLSHSTLRQKETIHGVAVNATTEMEYRIHNWTQLQTCLGFVRNHPTSATKTKTNVIDTIHILGERHSGTKFVQQELQRCFPRSSTFRVHRDLERSKHFFQPLNFNCPGDKSHNLGKPESGSVLQEDYSNHLIIAVFRDPMDWVEAMRLKPYHAPMHMAGFSGPQNDIVPLDWKTFLSQPWTTKTTGTNQKISGTAAATTASSPNDENATIKTCRYGFAPHEIVPCFYNRDSKFIPPNRIRGFEPIYELQRNDLLRESPATTTKLQASSLTHRHLPFDNILDLRAEKIRHLALEIPLLLPNLGGYWPVRYEDLLQSGMQDLVDWISHNLNISSPCHASSVSLHEPSRKQRVATGPQLDLLNKRQSNMPKEQKQWIQSHSYVPMEELLGYFQTVDGKDRIPPSIDKGLPSKK